MKALNIVLLAVILLSVFAGTAFADAPRKGMPEVGEIPTNQAPARNGEQVGAAKQNGPCGPACRINQPSEIPTGGSETVPATEETPGPESPGKTRFRIHWTNFT